MATVNISLPEKLKDEAQILIEGGFYSSFSDLVRDSIRQLVYKGKYDLWAQEAKNDLKSCKAKILRSPREIEDYMKSL